LRNDDLIPHGVPLLSSLNGNRHSDDRRSLTLTTGHYHFSPEKVEAHLFLARDTVVGHRVRRAG
jgi:hypothetical protein